MTDEGVIAFRRDDDTEINVRKWREASITLLSPDGLTAMIRVETGGRVFVAGEETSDVERIGAAFRAWALAVRP